MDAERAEQPRGIRVVFVLLAHSLVLDWAGPAEALRIANQQLVASGKAARFALEFVSPRPDALTSVGVALHGLAPLPTQWDGDPAWVVLVGLPGNAVSVWSTCGVPLTVGGAVLLSTPGATAAVADDTTEAAV